MPEVPRPNPAALPGAQADLATQLRFGSAVLQERLDRLDTLVELIRSMSQTLDLRKEADALLVHAHGWLPAACIAVVMRDERAGVSLVAHRGPTASFEESLLKIGDWVTQHDEDFMTANLQTDTRIAGAPEATVVALALRARRRACGAVIALDPAPSSAEPNFPDRLHASLRTVLEPPGLMLDTALHVQRLNALSVTDDLTGLYNARYLHEVLRRETKRASRNGRPLALLFLDLDGFKAVNDAHGHLSGSRALVEAATVLRICARETDIVARYGGDEFALVLPDTSGDGGLAVAERARDRISRHAFLTGDGLDIHLTASVGVAVFPNVAASAEQLIMAADMAMYRIKGGGKNGAHLATDALVIS
jgi:diguanylate cyclase (GGDEF)-like protein